ncbi:hypothetical protein LOTGIDRAFT_156898 [Lottia gigantea]|uniref:Uncharacterized protein n=1 Tax=Lottia gigantea TaxID=225164 RepID=V4BAG3_LOTGI|nr:hypothetical protein LOTGIDRAFT_156898 [Lottia gigantea]ESP02942.1 hypothetical protein LOTGIDRAFT_156898 [Lottia gigantea]
MGRVVDFLQETSLHGCKYISDTTRSLARRIIWALFFTAASASCIFYCVELGLRLLEFNVQTIFRLEHKDSLAFPTIVICNPCPINVTRNNDTETLFQSGILWSSNKWNILRENSSRSFTIEDINKIKDEKKIDMQASILQARWDEKYLNISESFKPFDLLDKSCVWFNGKDYQSKYGAFIGENSGYDAGLEVIANVHQNLCSSGFVLEAGLEIYIQPVEDDIPSLSPAAIVAPGTATNIGLSKSTMKFLEYPYKVIGDRYCTSVANYSKSNCNEGCISKKLRERCPCLPTLFEGETDFGEFENCTTDNVMAGVDCYSNYYPLLKSQADKGDICDCPDTCAVSSYSIDLSFGYFPTTSVSQRLVDIGYIPDVQYARDNLLKFRINFKTLVEEIIEYVPEYSAETMIGTIGGHLGLFVGASILTIFEIVELFVLLVGTRVFKLFNRPSNISKLS